MKYNININQKALADSKLDLIDSAILDYIVFYCGSANEKIEKQRKKNENGIWTWINLGTLLEDMPLLRIKTSGALSRRIKKIAEEGYIDTLRPYNRKLFVKINKKRDELVIESNSTVADEQQLQGNNRCRRATNNNTIDNNTTNKEKIGESSPTKQKEFPIHMLFVNTLKKYQSIASLDGTPLNNKRSANLLISRIKEQLKLDKKETSIENIKKVFVLLLRKLDKDNFYKSRATSITFLYNNFNKILKL